MYAHKKLLIAVIILSVFVTFFSLTIYLTTVSQSSHAMSKDDLLKLKQQLRGEIGRKVPTFRGVTQAPVKAVAPLEATLSTDKTTIKAAGNLDLDKDFEKIDKTPIIISFKNNSGKKIKNAALSVTLTNKKDVGKEKVPFKYFAYDLGDIKEGESGKATLGFYSKEPKTVEVRAALNGKDGEKAVPAPLTITVQ